MQNIQSISTTKLRNQLAEVLEKVAIGKQTFIVSKFGKKKAKIVPVKEEKETEKKDLDSFSAWGMWQDRDDLKDSKEWVSDLRKKQSERKEQ